MLPLLLGLGLLAGHQFMKDRRADDIAGQYRGLLGTLPGPMGPPDEAGQMGHTGGTGLLADPKDVGRQLEFAAGVTGLRGQQGAGLQLLNAAFGRAQQEAERQQSGQQYAQQFQRQGEQFERSFGAGREDAAASAERWGKEFEQREKEAQRMGEQWREQFGLSKRADARGERALDLEERKLNVKEDAAPKLPAGWMYQAGPAGEAIAAPIPGTTDWAAGTAKAETLQSADERIGGLLDLIEGKETTTLAGRKVKLGGHGSELWGQTAERYSTIRGQIISDMAKLREMGVLQAGEYEQINKQLRDPTDIGAIFTSNKTLTEGYKEVQKQFRDKREQHFRANPWLIPPVPKGYEPVKH